MIRSCTWNLEHVTLRHQIIVESNSVTNTQTLALTYGANIAMRSLARKLRRVAEMSSRHFVMVCIAVCVLSIPSCETPAFGEELGVVEVLKSVVRQRQKPQLFVLNYRIRDQLVSRVQKEDGVGEFGRIVETKGEVRFDEEAELLYVDWRVKLVDVLNDDDKKMFENLANKSGFKLVDGRTKHSFTRGDNRVRSKPMAKDKSLENELPFQMKSFCLGQVLDVEKGTSFEKLVSMLLASMKGLNCSLDENGLAVLDLGNEVYKFDVERDYWPIEHKQFVFNNVDGKRVPFAISSQVLTLTEYKGDWLPHVLQINERQKFVEYEFIWESFDEPIDPKYFDMNAIIEKWEKGEEIEKQENKGEEKSSSVSERK